MTKYQELKNYKKIFYILIGFFLIYLCLFLKLNVCAAELKPDKIYQGHLTGDSEDKIKISTGSYDDGIKYKYTVKISNVKVINNKENDDDYYNNFYDNPYIFVELDNGEKDFCTLIQKENIKDSDSNSFQAVKTYITEYTWNSLYMYVSSYGVTFDYTIQIDDLSAYKSITLPSKLSIYRGESKKIVYKNPTPTNALRPYIHWKSSDKNIATVDENGKIKGKKNGTCYVTATLKNKKSYQCKITVQLPPKLQSKNLLLSLNETAQAKLLYINKSIKWKSSNTKIATVNSKGIIKAKKAGKCTISTTYEGKTYKISVTVKNPELNYTKFYMYRGCKYDIKLLNTIKKVTWTSTNKNIATVDSKGVITGKSLGKCKIIGTYMKKKYVANIIVEYLNPNFGAYTSNYKTRDNYFLVKFKNNGKKTLTITSGIKARDVDYKEWDRKLKLKSTIQIKPNQTKYVKFYVVGSYAYPDYKDYTIYYNFKYDGKTYEGHVWSNNSVYKSGKYWYRTYWSTYEDWYYYWY